MTIFLVNVWRLLKKIPDREYFYPKPNCIIVRYTHTSTVILYINVLKCSWLILKRPILCFNINQKIIDETNNIYKRILIYNTTHIPKSKLLEEYVKFYSTKTVFYYVIYLKVDSILAMDNFSLHFREHVQRKLRKWELWIRGNWWTDHHKFQLLFLCLKRSCHKEMSFWRVKGMSSWVQLHVVEGLRHI